MNIERIYIDMDGVLADFDRGMVELCSFPMEQPTPCTPEWDDALYDAMRAIPHFYDKLQPMPGALEMMSYLMNKYGDRVEILSAAPKPFRRIETAKDDKISWARRFFGDKLKVHIVTREEKKDFCTGKGAILIDDYDKNTIEWERCGGTAILYSSPQQAMAELQHHDTTEQPAD